MTWNLDEGDRELTELCLRCKDKRHRNAWWTLKLLKDGADLYHDSNTLQASFSSFKAQRRFVFPSFWESVKDLGIVLDNDDTVWFEHDQDDLRRIRRFLTRALAEKGPDAIQSVRRRGWTSVLGGSALLLVGIIGLVASAWGGR